MSFNACYAWLSAHHWTPIGGHSCRHCQNTLESLRFLRNNFTFWTRKIRSWTIWVPVCQIVRWASAGQLFPRSPTSGLDLTHLVSWLVVGRCANAPTTMLWYVKSWMARLYKSGRHRLRVKLKSRPSPGIRRWWWAGDQHGSNVRCAQIHTPSTLWVTGGSGAGGLTHRISSINSNPSYTIQCIYLSLGAGDWSLASCACPM